MTTPVEKQPQSSDFSMLSSGTVLGAAVNFSDPEEVNNQDNGSDVVVCKEQSKTTPYSGLRSDNESITECEMCSSTSYQN